MTTSIATRHGATLLLVNDKGELLLKLRDDAPLWCLPGGFAEAGETPVQNVCREVQEELTLTLQPERLVHIVGYKFYQPYNSSSISAHMFYLPYGGEPLLLGDEGVALQFFALQALPLNMFANQREMAFRALPRLPQPFVEMVDLGRDATLDILPSLAPEQIAGLAAWRIHPRVLEKRAAGQLKFDL